MNDDEINDKLLRRFQLAQNEISNTPSEVKPITEEEKHDFAVHEASHAVIAYQLGVIFIKTSLSNLDPMHGGNTYFGKDKEYTSGIKNRH